jgi:membrane-bound metal-dependent hydrolase YbcI (DUF457 family)
MVGTSISFVEYPSSLSHSIALYALFIFIFVLGFSIKKRSIVGLVFVGAIFSHLLFDFLVPDPNLTKLVYLLYPFDPSNINSLYRFPLSDANFWLIDLSVFILGIFIGLWAFSKKSGRADLAS